MRIRLHPEAETDLLDAHLWYHDRSPLTATAFASTLDEALVRIASAPYQYPLADEGLRKLSLPTFPFSIFYRVDENLITVFAVAHQRRQPGYWSNRIEG